MTQWLSRGITRAFGYTLAYVAWIAVFRLFALTLITYFLISSHSRFQDISDAYGANELMLMGLGALFFLVLIRLLNPLTKTTADEIFTPHRFEKRFAPGFFHGAILAMSVVVAFLISGLYRYLGFFIQPEEGPVAIISVLLKILTLGCLVYCEEFIFRYRIMNYLRRNMSDLYAVILTAAIYCLVKTVQFDLGIKHAVTLLLVSLAIAIRTIHDGDFTRGAGFWAGILIVFHPLLGLPIFGNDYQGVLLIKYQSLEGASGSSATSQFLTGGPGGPVSSFVLQLLLLFDITVGLIKNKKTLLNLRTPRIR